jgi:nucleotide-binding universal stress UspA family protein
MAELSRILVPIDGSETSLRAANTAVDLAKRYGASITVLHVISIDLYLQAIGIYRLSYPDSVKNRVDEARKEANKWFDPIRRTAEQYKV